MPPQNRRNTGKPEDTATIDAEAPDAAVAEVAPEPDAPQGAAPDAEGGAAAAEQPAGPPDGPEVDPTAEGDGETGGSSEAEEKVPAEGGTSDDGSTLTGESAHDAAVASWRRNNPEADLEE